ncbi:MAG: hypothetical protein A2005_03840 [Desulfuromonadales bacterium GWC2_61_20]|nr:MAG: hypothetical protein A2005_03840 [Desulfuromonadales bacterium GWC2_61_20]HAD03666.1 lipoprotein-releasing ABC transporter permease subunit [Desulfuromonas sp.]
MSYEWFITLRYLRAKRKQTFISVISFISIAGVTLGVAALIVVLAVMTGFHDGVRQQILGNIPHLLVQRYGEDLADYGQVAERVRKASPGVLTVSPFMSKEGMLIARGSVAAVTVKGVAPGNKIFAQRYRTFEGGNVEQLLFAESVTAPPGIVIGLDTASTLGVSLGDSISVIPPMFSITPFGMMPKMQAFRIVGISRQRGGFLDTYFAYISLPEAQRLLASPDRVTGIEVEVATFEQAKRVALDLRREFPYPYVVRSWEDLFGSFLSALKLEKLGLFIVLGIIVLVAAFNIATTLIMVVMEKHKDIAILRAMGATAESIMKIFVFEGLVIGTLGTGLGTLLGTVLARFADNIIKGIERLFGIRIFDQAVYGMERFPSVVYASDVFLVALMAMTICLLATIYPAYRASRMDPAEALRYD